MALVACLESLSRFGHMVSQDGRMALILAAERGQEDTVELLLDRGAGLEAKGRASQARLLF